MIGGLIILNVFIAGAAVALGLFLLLSQGRDKQRFLFALLNLTIAVWILSNYFGSALIYPLVMTDYIAGALLGLLFWLFSRETRQKALVSTHPARKLKNLPLIVVFTTVVTLICLTLSGLIITLSTDPVQQAEIVTNGLFYAAYPFAIFALAIFSIDYLIKAYVKSHDTIQKTQVKLMLIGLSIAFVCIATPNLILENILPKDSDILVASYGISNLGILVFLVLSTYAIVRHRLFDVKLAAVRSTAYLGVLLTLSGVYYLFAYLLSTIMFDGHATDSISVSPVNIILALLLAFLFQPIKRFFDRVTNDVFYRDVYKSDEFFAELSQLLVSTTDLRGLLERASKDMADTFKAEQAFFFLYYKNTIDHHMSAGTRHHTKLPVHDARILDEYVLRKTPAIILSNSLIHESNLHRMLISHKIAMVMPLRRGEQVIGYVCLGDPLSGRYTKRDIQVLSTIADELVIAIQNALSLHEIKELNATLQQKIDVATKELRYSNAQLRHLDEVKDEFMSMASHQLRTPLTSIKGYMSMVLEGDMGEISPQQRKVLGEAFNSSERMVRLIADFLNVSRLQTGKFIIEKTSFDLGTAVQQEVSSLHLMMTTHDLNLKLRLPKTTVLVVADEAKIRQVVMNFIDNAIYYSPPGSDVTIHLGQTADGIDFTVTDSGIGVPQSEQMRLFDKFFRASNARRQRPDGTGVGLYLAKKIITAHGGSIIFHSIEGKWSTFGFHLPNQSTK